ncbi:MAG TPA: winged helix-turn-helix domain-containing protein [Nitrososphaerales archaeon]|nr:winged helix-turn-helix domain-containing protein [Nitrososphaerales archaeon]
MKKRETIVIQMEILASLFASPKVVTRLAQSCNVNLARMGSYSGPMLVKGLIKKETRDGQEVYSITEGGYQLYKDWLEVWRRLSL